MKLEKPFLVAAFVALVVALPVYSTLQAHANQLKIERNDSAAKQLRIQSVERQLEEKQHEIEQQKQKEDELNKQLQSKRAAQVTVASAAPVQQVPASAPVAVLASVHCTAYSGLISQYNWPVATMTAICQAESGGNPNAVSPLNYDGLRDYGLFQIHGEAILDPAANVARAYGKYTSQGLGAWSVYNNGRYLSYLQ